VSATRSWSIGNPQPLDLRLGLTYEMVVALKDPTRPPMDRAKYSSASKCVSHVFIFGNLSGGGRDKNIFLD
jgi:hypothetical protein